jgi:hypothetical protein
MFDVFVTKFAKLSKHFTCMEGRQPAPFLRRHGCGAAFFMIDVLHVLKVL